MTSELQTAAETAVTQCLGLTADERCVIVADDGTQRIGEALYNVARTISADTSIVRYPPGDQHGEEPPAPVAAAMAAADVVLAPTTKSLSHTRARSDANEAGARVATLPGITERVFTTGLDVDYAAIERHTQDVYDAVCDAETIRVTAPAGTDITFEIGERQFQQDTGIVHTAGEMSNLPAGEAFVSPVSATGTFVVDGTMMPHGLLEDDQTLAFTVENGQVTEIEDPEIRKQIETAAEEVGQAAYNLAELGIGTNVAVTELVGSVLLDEKAAQTVHIAIGDDASIGGDVSAPLHLDGIITDPTVTVDGETLSLPAADE